MDISQYCLAKAIDRPESEISEIVNGKRSITVEMASLLSHALDHLGVLDEPRIGVSDRDRWFAVLVSESTLGIAIC